MTHNNTTTDTQSYLQTLNYDQLQQINFKDLFAYTPEEAFTFNRFINDCEADILRLLTSNDDNSRSLNFISAMNSGKTFSLIDICNRNNINAIIAVPLQVIARQKYNEYSRFCDENNIPCNVSVVHGRIDLPDGRWESVTNHQITEILSQNNQADIFITVYDSLQKFYTISEFDPSNYILIVDEAHNLVTQFNFRRAAISFLLDYQNRFKKLIHLTGTPEGALNPNHKTYTFTNPTPIPEKRINLINYLESKNIKRNWMLFDILRQNTEPGIKVVLLDNKDTLERMKRALIRSGKDENSIMVLHSDNKDNPSYHYIEVEEQIPENIEYLLTTRLIADGANIKSDIKSLYILDVKDFWIKRQFIGRFRNSLENVYDFIGHNSNIDADILLDLPTNLTQYINSSLQQLSSSADFYNESIGVSNSRFNYNPILYTSIVDKIYKTSYSLILNNLINKINNASHRNPISIGQNRHLLHKLYEEIAGWVVDYRVMDSYSSQDLPFEDFDRYWKLFEISSIADSPEFFKEHVKNIFQVYSNKKLKITGFSDIIDRSLLSQVVLFDEYLTKDYWECMNDEKAKLILKEMINLVYDGFSADFIGNLIAARIAANNNDTNIKEFNRLLRIFRWRLNSVALQTFPQVLSIEMPNLMREYLSPYILTNHCTNREYLTDNDKKALKQIITEIIEENHINEITVNTLSSELINALFEHSPSCRVIEEESVRVTNIQRREHYKDTFSEFNTFFEKNGISFRFPILSKYLKSFAKIPYLRLKRHLYESLKTLSEPESMEHIDYDSTKDKILDLLSKVDMLLTQPRSHIYRGIVNQITYTP